ncbi:hypothetical protein [Serratia fonticola]
MRSLRLDGRIAAVLFPEEDDPKLAAYIIGTVISAAFWLPSATSTQLPDIVALRGTSGEKNNPKSAFDGDRHQFLSGGKYIAELPYGEVSTPLVSGNPNVLDIEYNMS